ncbi:hypothetical protein GGX14DRAFT_576143 [Mycena pura]|uniref:Uncharacterized protein n=1 Tax=Mycena pura TaxID=153505 RepID=A0AAD6UU39_9AGAR|nr:hypothetical protein GGX14DRAFT_576143 [Mycena pura]
MSSEEDLLVLVCPQRASSLSSQRTPTKIPASLVVLVKNHTSSSSSSTPHAPNSRILVDSRRERRCVCLKRNALLGRSLHGSRLKHACVRSGNLALPLGGARSSATLNNYSVYYNNIIDFFESAPSPTSRKKVQELLCCRIFPRSCGSSSTRPSIQAHSAVDDMHAELELDEN